MQIILNGDPYTAPDACNVLGLLAALSIDPARVAIELDGAILKKTEWERTTLSPGSKIEVVMFVGGG